MSYFSSAVCHWRDGMKTHFFVSYDTFKILCVYAGFRLTCHLPHCSYAAWSSLAVFRVAALSGKAALAFHRAAIAPELNRIQLSVICRGGQSGKVIDLLAWRCLPLGHPSAASDACAVELISSSKRQCGKRQVSLKPASFQSSNQSIIQFYFEPEINWSQFWT